MLEKNNNMKLEPIDKDMLIEHDKDNFRIYKESK
jgi:hypothetical protein